MKRRVTYKTLWLVSARDGSARKQLFSQKTLLLGPNGTGKSRIIKVCVRPTHLESDEWAVMQPT